MAEAKPLQTKKATSSATAATTSGRTGVRWTALTIRATTTATRTSRVTHRSTGLAKTATSKVTAKITAFVSVRCPLNHSSHRSKNCGTHPPYSPKCVEEVFSEVRIKDPAYSQLVKVHYRCSSPPVPVPFVTTCSGAAWMCSRVHIWCASLEGDPSAATVQQPK
jgi:hypothetical protein